jgi:hypothetical protein
MKKLVLIAGVFALGMTASNALEMRYAAVNATTVNIGEAEWMKSTSQTWTGMHDMKKTWYKMNTKDASLWWSTDEGKTWAAVADGMWQDKEGKWLKVNEGKLVWSADGGKTWIEVPDWTWQDADGTWCKFDKDWTLWTKKGR